MVNTNYFPFNEVSVSLEMVSVSGLYIRPVDTDTDGTNDTDLIPKMILQ